ncbi:beta-ketoacyl-ACP synthase III [Streptomyces polygonati]|uniref:Beta-ketoacyl-[acyl-carrier-protein] synthase III n=1 Tax=Streptomyces polygonati TaxID=1617087 RepID=A0ABV8HI85_9ACTN
MPGESRPGRAAVIAGLGAWLPPTIVTNDDLAKHLDTSDAWIRERTGIHARRRVSPGMSTGDMATEAGRLALKASGSADADAVVLATTTPDRRCPGTAPEVASRLGLTGTAAFDVSAVCTGFVYGLGVGAGLIAAGIAERVLLIGAEAFSTILDPADRVTAAIFGDGAGAVVLRAGDPEEPGAIGPVTLGSDGGQSDLIMIPGGGARQRSAGTEAGPKDHYFTMNGPDTYRHAVERTTATARLALDKAGWLPDDVDRFAAHQANARIVGSVADRLGIPAGERRLSNIDQVGNTAAASVPILLAQSAAAGTLRAGHRTLLAAFGGGLTWGAGTVVWPETTSLVATGADSDSAAQTADAS